MCCCRILIVDDHALFREAVARFLLGEPGFEVVGGCGTIEEAHQLLRENIVDLVLLDFDLGPQNGIAFMECAEDLGYKGKVLVATAEIGTADAATLLKQGVAGILHKHAASEQLLLAIQTILTGRVWVEPPELQMIVGAASEDKSALFGALTDRERKVLSLVCMGKTNRDMFKMLQMSESSVKSTLHQLFQKTGVQTRSQLVRVALESRKDEF